jgi:sugar phosphate permease
MCHAYTHSGQIADRVNLRYFLTLGMLGSAISVMLLGVAYYANIHHIGYFIGVQILGGIMQSTGWPGVVSVMSHWFGKQRRGLIMGIWNAHTSLGNILGTIIPSFWANPTVDDPTPPWGLSFIIPSLIMAVAAMLVFYLLVVDPRYVGLKPPIHHLMQGRVWTIIDDKSKLEGSDTVRKAVNKSAADEVKVEDDSAATVQSSPRATSPLPKAVGFFRALRIPGVIEYALALFFNKLVSYTFLFWLPYYVKESHPQISSEESDWLATLFDVGGIFGGIVTGILSDVLNARAVSCVISLILAVPSLFFLRYHGDDELWLFIVLLCVCGVFINGPYAIITTAVSSDLGTHPSLSNNQNAKATVTAIIDGTGSLGAALGPLLIGWLTDASSWNAAFYLLMASCFLSAVFMTRLLVVEVIEFAKRFCAAHNRRTH